MSNIDLGWAEALGMRLRAERAAANMTQAQFAELGEVTARTQRNYEAGSRVPDAAYLSALAVAGLIDANYVLIGVRHDAAATPPQGQEACALPERDEALMQRLVNRMFSAVIELGQEGHPSHPVPAGRCAAAHSEAAAVLARAQALRPRPPHWVCCYCPNALPPLDAGQQNSGPGAGPGRAGGPQC